MNDDRCECDDRHRLRQRSLDRHLSRQVDHDALESRILVLDGAKWLVGDENANWCTYATWASRSAGRFIRDDEVPAPLLRVLADALA